MEQNGKDYWDRVWATWNDVFTKGGKMEFVFGPVKAVR